MRKTLPLLCLLAAPCAAQTEAPKVRLLGPWNEAFLEKPAEPAVSPFVLPGRGAQGAAAGVDVEWAGSIGSLVVGLSGADLTRTQGARVMNLKAGPSVGVKFKPLRLELGKLALVPNVLAGVAPIGESRAWDDGIELGRFWNGQDTGDRGATVTYVGAGAQLEYGRFAAGVEARQYRAQAHPFPRMDAVGVSTTWYPTRKK